MVVIPKNIPRVENSIITQYFFPPRQFIQYKISHLLTLESFS